MCCRFEVEFMGAEARIDMQPSGDWLREITAKWPWPVHIKVRMSCCSSALLIPLVCKLHMQADGADVSNCWLQSLIQHAAASADSAT